jgi:hypothetical protein
VLSFALTSVLGLSQEALADFLPPQHWAFTLVNAKVQSANAQTTRKFFIFI